MPSELKEIPSHLLLLLCAVSQEPQEEPLEKEHLIMKVHTGDTGNSERVVPFVSQHLQKELEGNRGAFSSPHHSPPCCGRSENGNVGL